MAMEFFKEEGRGFVPRASIRKQGQIGLNHGAVTRYNIKEYKHVLLGYDKDEKKVAMRLLKVPEQGARPIVVRQENVTIAAKAFLDFFEIPYTKTRQFDVKRDEDQQYLVFILKEEET